MDELNSVAQSKAQAPDATVCDQQHETSNRYTTREQRGMNSSYGKKLASVALQVLDVNGYG